MERINLAGQPLDLELTLNCGQAFRWRKNADNIWSGVVGDRLIELARDGDDLLWRTYPDGGKDLVWDYLRLNDDVEAIYNYLAARDSHLAELTHKLRGLRILRQDPAETILSFVCSAANSIPRIMLAIEGLSEQYGDLVCEKGNCCYYAFPKIEQIAYCEPLSPQLAKALGFRGDSLRRVAVQLLDRGEDWLMSLREVSYPEAKSALVEIKGIGQKIADCVCLFSLDKDNAVPVDTHVRQIAQRFFLPEMNAKTVTDSVYRRIVEAFIECYGEYAGWAQELLFYEDLLRTRALGRGLL